MTCKAVTATTFFFAGLVPLVGNANSSFYSVKEGDTLSQILHNNITIPNYTLQISTQSVKYREAYDELLKANPKILNPDKIYPGQKILVPGSVFSTATSSTYKIKSGDTLFGIIKKYYPQGNSWDALREVLVHNPQIADKDFIYEGHILKIPGTKLISTMPEKDVMDLNEKNETREPAQFESNDFLEKEIYQLSRKEAQRFIKIFRQIAIAESKVDVIVSLKKSLDLSRELGKDYLEENFLKLISVSLVDKKDSYVDRIKEFFLVWQDQRQKNHLNEKVEKRK
jgi:hypothetical protein